MVLSQAYENAMNQMQSSGVEIKVKTAAKVVINGVDGDVKDLSSRSTRFRSWRK